MIDWFINLYNMIMKKEYMLISVGGMNGEIWRCEGRYDSVEEVFKLGLFDINGYKFDKNIYEEDFWERYRGEIEGMFEGYYGDMSDGLDEWIDKDKESVNGVYLINEGLEMYELNIFDKKDCSSL